MKILIVNQKPVGIIFNGKYIKFKDSANRSMQHDIANGKQIGFIEKRKYNRLLFVSLVIILTLLIV